MSEKKSEKIITVSTHRADAVKERFKIIASLLSGKRDVTGESSHGPIVSDTALAASTIKSFLNKLVKMGYMDKKTFPIYIPAMPHVGYTKAHSEFVLNAAGADFVKDALERWQATVHYDDDIGRDIVHKLRNYTPYQFDKVEREPTYLEKAIKRQLDRGLYKYQVGLSLMNAGYSFSQIAEIMGVNPMTVYNYSIIRSQMKDGTFVRRPMENFLQFENTQEEARFFEACLQVVGKPRGRKNIQRG